MRKETQSMKRGFQDQKQGLGEEAGESRGLLEWVGTVYVTLRLEGRISTTRTELCLRGSLNEMHSLSKVSGSGA